MRIQARKKKTTQNQTPKLQENEMLQDLLYVVLPLVPIVNAIIVLYIEAD